MDGRPAGKEPFGGTWRVEGLEGFDREYIELTNPPLVRLVISRGGLVDGTFAFGAQEGELDGRIERPGEGPPRMAFTFEGWEEGDMIHGYGVAALVERDVLKGEMRYHRSDTIRFTWRRMRPEGPVGRCGGHGSQG